MLLLKLQVQLCPEVIGQAAILVEGGIGDNLIIHRKVDTLPNRKITIVLRTLLPAVTERTVTIETYSW